MHFSIEATRDFFVLNEEHKVVRKDANCVRKLDDFLRIRVYDKELLGRIDCTYYTSEIKVDCDAANYVYKYIGVDTDVLVCIPEIDLSYEDSKEMLQYINKIIAGAFKNKFNIDTTPVIAIFMNSDAFKLYKTLKHSEKAELIDEAQLVLFNK